MSNVYLYVVDRDFGFAPNPFHGVCTLATCKPRIRNTAQIGDWIFGLGGRKLKATGQCIFAMKISRKVTFNEYWLSEEFQCKKPARNGSEKVLLGDNIYFQNEDKSWNQAHSHHSLADGSINEHNLKRDTGSKNVLISDHFFYFGGFAPSIPPELMTQLNYINGRNHRVFPFEAASPLVGWVESTFSDWLNLVKADPFNFDNSGAHYSAETNRVS